MMRAECLLRTSLPDHPWPMVIRPEVMETDRNNDSGISPGRTSSEANSNSPNFNLNSPHSPDRRGLSPDESPNESHIEKESFQYIKSNEHYSFYSGKNSSYSPSSFVTQRNEETPRKIGVSESRSSPNSECNNSKLDKTEEMSEKSNDCEYDRDEMQTEDSLERLKNALEKSSALSGIFKSRADDSDGNDAENCKKEFPCPLCAYTTPYRHRYMEHLSTHYSDKCTLCDFTGQNVQDLRVHLQDVHGISDIHDLSDPQDNNSDYQDDDETPNKRTKPKSFKCKQCNYITTTKLDFWEHSKGHIKAEKLLTCPKCPFVTEYKHHLEYHLRNHFGSKPFKCTKCSYSCVNKSMLNSHLKSHSNVYQYRCADCAYATKYCHSLKLHLRKYQHKPAMVLNADGSPNPLPIIDIYGTRRGPKQKPSKSEDQDSKSIFLDIKVPDKEKGGPNLPGGIIVPNAPQISPNSPNSFYSLNNNDIKDDVHNGLSSKYYYCTLCDFHSMSLEFLNQHMFLHAAETNLAHILKTNNNVQDQNIMKDYFQNVLISQSVDQVPFIDSRSMSPLSLVSPKSQVPAIKPSASPLDLSKQESNESEGEDTRKKVEDSGSKDEKCNKLSSTKHRRKGKAYKLERINDSVESSPEEFYNGKSDEESSVIMIPDAKPKSVKEEEETEKTRENAREKKPTDKSVKSYSCIYCDIVFKDVVLYTMHMGYHGFQDPFTCNMCGHITPDKVSFFLHIARSSHS